MAQEVIQKLSHRFGSDVVTLFEPTCSEPGQQEGTCQLCKHKVKESIPATGVHDMEYHAKVAATETTNGCEEYFQCKECHNVYKDGGGKDKTTLSELVIPALGIAPSGGGSTGGSGDGSGGSSGGGSGSTGGNEGSVNPPLGGDTGLSGSGSASDIFKENWWWMAIILGVVLLLILLFAIMSALRSRKREKLALERERLAAERDRERDRQFETFMKMQMMHTYGGMNGFAPPADGGASAVEGQPQAQLPYNQEMLNVAVAAAMQAMQAMKGEEAPSAEAPDRENIDVDGFYDDVEEDK